jgi:tetratricopeptide (TPR) repeat protein
MWQIAFPNSADLPALRLNRDFYLIRHFLLWFLLPGIVLAADRQIQSLINRGDYESAFNLLQESADTSERNEEMLYLLGVTAPSGKSSSSYLKEYMQKFPQGAHIDTVRRQLANYYAAQGLNITASRMYPDTIDNSVGFDEQYQIGLCRQQAGEYKSAIDIFTQIMVESSDGLTDWARLGIADCNLLLGKFELAVDGYKEIIGSSSSTAPFALLGISEAFQRQGKLDRAENYYRTYKQNYPEAPGSLELEAALSEQKPAESDANIAQAIKAGYFIQVGVFSKKDNAKNCLRKFKTLKFQTKIEDFDEDGQRYYRVILGPYVDEQSARKTKAELEKSQGEEFLIFVE